MIIEYEGDGPTLQAFRSIIENSYGMFGHPIGEETTPMDLNFVMGTKFPGLYELVEGQEILDRYEPLADGLKS